MELIIYPKILLIENYAKDFYNSRLPYYNYLVNRGWDVSACVPYDGEYVEKIKENGVNLVIYELDRKNKGVCQVIKLIKTYRTFCKNFDIIHSFRFQPNILNVFANFFNKKKIILHVTGLGIAFSNHALRYKFLKVISKFVFFLKIFRANKIIVQNEDDKKEILICKYYQNKITTIYGSGINLSIFDKKNFNKNMLRKKFKVPKDNLIFICVTRLIWEKGIREMVDAFQELKSEYENLKLWIVGDSDKDNPRSIPYTYTKKFTDNETIRFWGSQKNISELLAMADVFVYPSYYREGIPRAILEALAIELPIITTDMPGCSMTVNSSQNGYLIQPRSKESFQNAVIKMAHSENLLKMGAFSRMLAEQKFSDIQIYSQMENSYKA